jgi:hypothetical protein
LTPLLNPRRSSRSRSSSGSLAWLSGPHWLHLHMLHTSWMTRLIKFRQPSVLESMKLKALVTIEPSFAVALGTMSSWPMHSMNTPLSSSGWPAPKSVPRQQWPKTDRMPQRSALFRMRMAGVLHYDLFHMGAWKWPNHMVSQKNDKWDPWRKFQNLCIWNTSQQPGFLKSLVSFVR